VRLRHVLPFTILLAWQAAPVQLEQEPSGRYRLSFGLGGGSYPYEYVGCSGAGTPATQVYASGGVELDARPADAVRVSVFGGPLTLAAGDQSVGIVGGGQAAWEGRLAGVGAGFVGTSVNAGRGGLSAYLRLGDADAAHVRVDLRQPDPAWLVSGWARVGLGYNLGLRRGFGAFVGLSQVLGHQPLHATPSDATAVFADLTFPLGRRGDLLLKGHLLGGGFGLGVGLRREIGP
jgi:hypothetical protein